jgi:hypothetical protein
VRASVLVSGSGGGSDYVEERVESDGRVDGSLCVLMCVQLLLISC